MSNVYVVEEMNYLRGQLCDLRSRFLCECGEWMDKHEMYVVEYTNDDTEPRLGCPGFSSISKNFKSVGHPSGIPVNEEYRGP